MLDEMQIPYFQTMRSQLCCLFLFLVLGIKSVDIIAYWEGYEEYGVLPLPLKEVSRNVSIVQIAFFSPLASISPNNKSTMFTFGIAGRTYTLETIARDIQILQGKGIKVLISIMDTKSVHWNDVDHNIFVYNVLTLMELWNLDGINIDGESGMAKRVYVRNFVRLIKTFRKTMDNWTANGNLTRKLLTYSTYQDISFDVDILAQTYNDIDILEVTSYFLNSTMMIKSFHHYARLMHDPTKVALGFAVRETTIPILNNVTAWLKAHNSSTAMLWSASQDVKKINGIGRDFFINTIYSNLS